MAIYQYEDRNADRQILREKNLMDAADSFANFLNQRQELQQNAPYKKALSRQANAMSGYYEQGASNGMVPLISGFDPQTGSPIISGMVPKGTQFSPMMKAQTSPSLIKAKDDRVVSLISMAEKNPLRLKQLKDAEELLGQLPQGLGGKLNIEWMKNFDPKNPLLSNWQNLKSILTEAQLEYVQKTKGAISDKEMQTFAQAVANDDLISLARMTPQIKKLKKSILSSQNAELKAFKKLYNEDPNSFADFSFADSYTFDDGDQQSSSSGKAVGKYSLVQ